MALRTQPAATSENTNTLQIQKTNLIEYALNKNTMCCKLKHKGGEAWRCDPNCSGRFSIGNKGKITFSEPAGTHLLFSFLSGSSLFIVPWKHHRLCCDLFFMSAADVLSSCFLDLQHIYVFVCLFSSRRFLGSQGHRRWRITVFKPHWIMFHIVIQMWC